MGGSSGVTLAGTSGNRSNGGSAMPTASSAAGDQQALQGHLTQRAYEPFKDTQSKVAQAANGQLKAGSLFSRAQYMGVVTHQDRVELWY